MVKKLIIVGTVSLILGSGIYVLTQSDDEPGSVNRSPVATNQPAPKPDSNTAVGSPAANGAYVDYSDSLIASTKGTKILFFHAPWCSQCQTLEQSIQTEGVPADVTIIKVDYDSSQSLRQKYGVTIQTTLVKIADDGTEQKKFVAYNDPSIDSVKQNLL